MASCSRRTSRLVNACRPATKAATGARKGTAFETVKLVLAAVFAAVSTVLAPLGVLGSSAQSADLGRTELCAKGANADAVEPSVAHNATTADETFMIDQFVDLALATFPFCTVELVGLCGLDRIQREGQQRCFDGSPQACSGGQAKGIWRATTAYCLPYGIQSDVVKVVDKGSINALLFVWWMGDLWLPVTSGSFS